MFDAAFVLLVIAALLGVVALCQPLAGHLRLPPPVLLGVVGVALGGFPILVSKLGWSGGTDVFGDAFAALPVSSATFIYVFLPLLVFEAGIATDVRRVIEDAAPILLLAIIATLVTTAVIGLTLWPLAGVPLVVCLLLGAVVATTDPAAVIAIFRDVGAPGRLTRLVEGEALLNDAAAIALFAVLLGMIVAAREPNIGSGLSEFFLSFVGGGLLGLVAGRTLLWVIPWLGEDRRAEGTLSLALAYGVFITADRLFHVSGVVAVLGSGLTVSALGRSRIAPSNWSFLVDLWDQIAFWARSLVFVLASILVPRLLGHIDLLDLGLLAVLVAVAFAARILVLFVMMPPLEYFKLTQPISAAYKLAIAWGGLRGALTLVLALAVTENSALDPQIQRFVAVLATGLVLFTLFVNGTTLRLVIALLGLDRLSPRNEVLRDRILALVVRGGLRFGAPAGGSPCAVTHDRRPDRRTLPGLDYGGERPRCGGTIDRERPTGDCFASPWRTRSAHLLSRRVLLELRRRPLCKCYCTTRTRFSTALEREGRLGYQRASDATLSFPVAFRVAYFLYRHFGIRRLLADSLADRVELLLVTRLLLDRLVVFNNERLRPIFGERITELTGEMIERRRDALDGAFDALHRQYPDYVAALEVRFLRQSAVRQETGRYQALFEEGLIPQELFEDLKRGVAATRAGDPRPRFDMGLDTRRLIERLDLLSALTNAQLDRIAQAAAASVYGAERADRPRRRAR